MIAILCSRTPQNISADELARLAASLFPSAENREYFEALKKSKNEDGAKDSFYALIILAKALVLLPSKVNMNELALKKSDKGKPYFENSDIAFSLSHSKEAVACAVSDSGQVGIDIEAAIVEEQKAIKLAKRFFCSADAQAVKNTPDIFTRLWSEKEAKTKFFGEDLSVFLKNEQIEDKNSLLLKIFSLGDELSLHAFTFEGIPVTLCATRKNSTILFKRYQ